jgi:hypothetical protein
LATDPFEPLMTFRPRIAGKRSEADPDRSPLLAADMRRRLVRRLARDLSASHIAELGGLRGTLVSCAPLPSGRVYAHVLDERSRRFVVVPMTPDLRRLEGRTVDLSIDARGQLAIGPTRRLNRGDR